MNDLILDLHGNTLSEGDVVKNRNGYFGTIVKKESKLVIKYDSGHCYYLDDSQAARLEKIANPELFFLGQDICFSYSGAPNFFKKEELTLES